jgi:hypothetical protein
VAERASGGVRGETSEELRREKLVELYDAIQPGDGSMPDMDRIRSTAEHVWPILSAVSDPAEPSGSPEPTEAGEDRGYVLKNDLVAVSVEEALELMCPTSEPSGSRVTAPPPEPSEAMKQALAALQAVVDNSLCERCDPNGKLLIRASDARRPLEAALAVSPGCRGAELAELERALESYDAGGHPPERAATFALVDAVRKVLAAFRASGEAGPDPLAERVSIAALTACELLETIEPTTHSERWAAAQELRDALSSGGVVG